MDPESYNLVYRWGSTEGARQHASKFTGERFNFASIIFEVRERVPLFSSTPSVFHSVFCEGSSRRCKRRRVGIRLMDIIFNNKFMWGFVWTNCSIALYNVECCAWQGSARKGGVWQISLDSVKRGYSSHLKHTLLRGHEQHRRNTIASRLPLVAWLKAIP